MGGCQSYGPFFGYPKYYVPYHNRDPKRDHSFDNHPLEDLPKQLNTPVRDTRFLR